MSRVAGIQIRLVARPGELSPKVQAVLDRLDSATFPADESYQKTGKYWWVAYRGSTPVAFAGLKLVDKGQSAFLCRAGVRQKYRGRGLHRRLIAVRERMGRRLAVSCFLTYTSDNIPSSNNLIRAGYHLYTPTENWAGPGVLYWCKPIRQLKLK
jgi:GNAT superfamily N-acetyltransferase